MLVNTLFDNCQRFRGMQGRWTVECNNISDTRHAAPLLDCGREREATEGDDVTAVDENIRTEWETGCSGGKEVSFGLLEKKRCVERRGRDTNHMHNASERRCAKKKVFVA